MLWEGKPSFKVCLTNKNAGPPEGPRPDTSPAQSYSQLFPDPHLGERPPELLLDAALTSESVVGVLVAGAVLEPLQSALDGGQQLFFDGDLDPEVGGDVLVRWLR
jgi:hypothetical protein